jgi:hypothetical protein
MARTRRLLSASASGANSSSSRVGYRVLATGDTTTETWTNATEIQVLVLRGQNSSPIGDVRAGGASGTVVEYEAFGPNFVGSLMVGMVGHRTATNVHNQSAGAEWTTRSSSGSVTSLGAHTNPTSGDGGFYTVNASSGWRSYHVEIRTAAVVQKQTSEARISLSSANAPASRTSHEIHVRARKTSSLSGSLSVSLYEGATLRETLSTGELTTTMTEYTLHLDDATAAAIGVYADLELRLQGISAVGDATTFEVARVSMNVPAGTAGSHSGAGTMTLAPAISAQGDVNASGAKSTAAARISLASGFTPITRTAHKIVVRARTTSAAGTIRAQLYEGATPRSAEIESSALTTSLATYELAIADADAATISSYSDLEVRLRGYAASGTATVFEVAQVSLSIPTAGSPTGNVEGAATVSALTSVGAGTATVIYPGTNVYPKALALLHSVSSISVGAEGVSVFGSARIDATAIVVAGGASPPTSKTGLVSILSTSSVGAAPSHLVLGHTLIQSVSTISLLGAAVQDVTGSVAISAATSVSPSGILPEVPPPTNFSDLPGDLPDVLLAIAFPSPPLSPNQFYNVVQNFSRAITSRRGRQFELERIEAGTSSFLLSNRDGRFNPENTSSPYYPNVKPTRRMKWQLAWNSVIYPIFEGFLEGFPQDYPHYGKDAVVRQQAVDGFMALSNARLIPTPTTLASEITTVPTAPTTEVIDVPSTALPFPQSPPFEIVVGTEKMTVTAILSGSEWRVDRIVEGATTHAIGTAITTDNVSFGQEYTGTRIRHLLELVGLTPAQMSLDAGQSLLAPSDNLAGQSPLEHAMLVAEVEHGRFFMSAGGIATFHDRHRFFRDEKTSRGTFGDGGGELPYAEVVIDHDDEKLYNVIRITPANGVTVELRDEASIADHFERVYEKVWPLADANEALSAAQYLLSRYSRMQVRVPELKVKGQSDPSVLWPILLGLDFGQRFRLIRRATGTPIDKQLVVEGVRHDLGVDQMQTTLQLALADSNQYWQIETAGYSELGTTTRLTY